MSQARPGTLPEDGKVGNEGATAAATAWGAGLTSGGEPPPEDSPPSASSEVATVSDDNSWNGPT
jgi:hypothetical protein